MYAELKTFEIAASNARTAPSVARAFSHPGRLQMTSRPLYRSCPRPNSGGAFENTQIDIINITALKHTRILHRFDTINA